MEIGRGRYHHGDLRAALIDAGLRALEGGASETLSLREVARSVRVSAPAVYRHFPDKAAFLTALAGEGLTRLAHAQAEASHLAGEGSEGFAASGQAYVRFALDNPGLFRLIFASNAMPSEDDVALSPGHLLNRHVAQTSGGASRAERAIIGYRAWALVHGLAMLILDGQIPRGEGEALIAGVVGKGSIGV